MIVIREEQLQSLQTELNLRYAKSILPEIMASHPSMSKALREDEILAKLHQMIAKAQAHEFTSDRDIFAFVNLCIIFGMEFPAQDSFDSVLTQPGIRKEDRMKMLLTIAGKTPPARISWHVAKRGWDASMS